MTWWEVKTVLNANRLIKSFEEIVGWPYVSPGSNDRNGIDCSGAFVRAFRAQGGNIYHGSNRIIRAHCRGVFQVVDAAQLVPGMAVFKRREDGSEPGEYKPGGGFFNPMMTGNFYHIGLVCSVNPLRIIHATPPVAKVDTVIKGTTGNPWGWAGWLKDVDYDAEEVPMVTQQAVVLTGLRMRAAPSEQGAYMLTIPQGSVIPVFGQQNGFAKTQWANRYGMHDGWVSEKHISYADDVEPGVDDPPDGADTDDPTVVLATAKGVCLAYRAQMDRLFEVT